MPFQLVTNQQTGYSGITGITAGGASLTLGTANLSLQIGPHFLGLDTSSNAAVNIVAAYDPAQESDTFTRSQLAGCRYAGHIQFGRLLFLGQPVPPSLFGWPLSELQPYAAVGGSDEHEFVDFMGPAQVATYLASGSDPTSRLDPFFPLVSVMSEQIANFDDLFTFPHANGALVAANPSGPAAALGAVMRGGITLTQISAPQVSAAIAGRTPLVSVNVTPQQVAAGPIALLAFQALAQQAKLDAEDRSIGQADITRGRQVGPYTLLSVANYEDEEPVLCVSVADGTLLVHLLPWEDVQQLERRNTDDLLASIADYFTTNAIALGDVQVRPPARGRGTGGGLSANAFPWLDGPCLELRFRTVVFGKQVRATRRSPLYGLSALSGLEWGLTWSLDSDNRVFTLGEVRKPQLMASPAGLLFGGALAAYYAALEDPTLRDATVDVSNFGQVELNALDFGGTGSKRKFVSDDDESDS